MASLSGDADGRPLGDCLAVGSSASAVADSGKAAGVSVAAASGVLWDHDGNAVALPALRGDVFSWAKGINAAGVVVGFSLGGTGRTAVIWR